MSQKEQGPEPPASGAADDTFVDLSVPASSAEGDSRVPVAADENTIFEGVTTAERQTTQPSTTPGFPPPPSARRTLETAETVFDGLSAIARRPSEQALPSVAEQRQAATPVIPMPHGAARPEPVVASDRHQLTEIGGFVVAPREPRAAQEVARTLESVYDSVDLPPKREPSPAAPVARPNPEPVAPPAANFTSMMAKHATRAALATAGLGDLERDRSLRGPSAQLTVLEVSGITPARPAREKARLPSTRTSSAKRGLIAASLGLFATLVIVAGAVSYRLADDEVARDSATIGRANALQPATPASEQATSEQAAPEPVESLGKPDLPTIDEELARAHLKAGRLEQARVAYRSLLQAHPERIEYQAILKAIDQKLVQPVPAGSGTP